jgi:hypothetical protein
MRGAFDKPCTWWCEQEVMEEKHFGWLDKVVKWAQGDAVRRSEYGRRTEQTSGALILLMLLGVAIVALFAFTNVPFRILAFLRGYQKAS